jgi:hypothetical protein
MIDDEAIEAAFGDLSEEDRGQALDAVQRLSQAVSDLFPFMDGADGGGQVRVGAMLVGLGKKLALS